MRISFAFRRYLLLVDIRCFFLVLCTMSRCVFVPISITDFINNLRSAWWGLLGLKVLAMSTWISNLSFCICYPRNNSHCQYKNRFSYYQKCNPIPKRQTRDIFCEMCDIPPHVINILESEYVLFADPPKYYITMCTIYNDWAGLKMLFCFFVFQICVLLCYI